MLQTHRDKGTLQAIALISTHGVRRPDIASSLLLNELAVWPTAGNAKKVVLKCEVTDSELAGMGTPVSFDVSVVIGKREAPLEEAIWSPATEREDNLEFGEFLLEGFVEGLEPTADRATLVLTPNPAHIEHRPEVTEIWGKPIRFPNLPLRRLDLAPAREPAADD